MFAERGGGVGKIECLARITSAIALFCGTGVNVPSHNCRLIKTVDPSRLFAPSTTKIEVDQIRWTSPPTKTPPQNRHEPSLPLPIEPPPHQPATHALHPQIDQSQIPSAHPPSPRPTISATNLGPMQDLVEATSRMGGWT